MELSVNAVAQGIERFLVGALTAEQLTDWADLIECREDIVAVPVEPINLVEVIFRLANPNLEGSVTRELAVELQQRLRGDKDAA